MIEQLQSGTYEQDALAQRTDFTHSPSLQYEHKGQPQLTGLQCKQQNGHGERNGSQKIDGPSDQQDTRLDHQRRQLDEQVRLQSEAQSQAPPRP